MRVKSGIDYTLYLVTDRLLAGNRAIEEVVLESVEGGVTLVQLREKNLKTRDFIDQALNLKKTLSDKGIPLIINDRLDVALACGADGVHLGQEDMSCHLAREILGQKMIIGVSVSNIDEALKAQEEGADYLGVSPVFATPTKTDAPGPTGLEGLRRIRRSVRLPLVGIGGISVVNAASVIRSGADGVAVVSAIMASPEPLVAAKELRFAMERIPPL